MYIYLERSVSPNKSSKVPSNRQSNFEDFTIMCWFKGKRIPVQLGEISLPKDFDIEFLEKHINLELI